MAKRNPGALDSVSGNGFTIDLYQNYGRDAVADRTKQAQKAGTLLTPFPLWGTLIGASWGSVLYQWIKTVGDPGGSGWKGDDVLTVPAYNIGNDGYGGIIWLVPTHTNAQWPDFSAPVWIEAHVYRDAVSEAVLQNAQTQNQADAASAVKAQQLADLQKQGELGNLDLQIALQKAKNGQGYQALELTSLLNGQSWFVALSPQESATCPIHMGQSIIDPGSWEELSNGRSPQAFGLPGAYLASQPNGGVRIAIVEYKKLIQIAQSQPVQPNTGNQWLSGFLGFNLPQPAAPVGFISYTINQIRAAQGACTALGIDWTSV